MDLRAGRVSGGCLSRFDCDRVNGRVDMRCVGDESFRFTWRGSVGVEKTEQKQAVERGMSFI